MDREEFENRYDNGETPFLGGDGPSEPDYAVPCPEPPEPEPFEPDYAAPYPEPPREEPPVRRYDSDDGQQDLWCDPVYESASADYEPYTPGRFAYGAQNIHETAAERPAAQPARGRGFLKALCLVLVCALAAGAAGWLGTELRLRRMSATPTNVHVLHGAAAPEPGETVSSVPGYTGQELTGTQIYYDLATSQVVGVNTALSTNIFGQSSKNAVSGSGFIFSADGYILTNYHVIAYAALYDGDLTVLMHDGASFPARIVGYVEDNDLAVIKIDAERLTPGVLGDSDAMKVGETVYAVGNPLGELTYTMTGGFVSALDRLITTKDTISGKTNSMNMFQFDAAVNSGNSGGPVYNTRGEIIGIVTAKSGETGVEGLGFAIPINDAVALATQLIERGFVSGAVLGVNVRELTAVYTSFILDLYHIPNGAYVESVVAGSAAEKAGVQAGDIITAVDDWEITALTDLKIALRHYNPGDTAAITVYRLPKALSQGEHFTFPVTFDEKAPEE